MQVRRVCAFALLLAVAASPAHSAVQSLETMKNIGTIHVDGQETRVVIPNELTGPITALQLRATKSPIDCRSVKASVKTGISRQLFRGRLAEGRSVTIHLFLGTRRFSSLTFVCRAAKRWGGQVRILAKVGRHPM